MDLLKLWGGAVELEKAWFTFAPPDKWLTFDYPQACRTPDKDAVSFTDSDWTGADEDERRYLASAISKSLKVRSPSASLAAQGDMKAWLLGELYRGRLIGVGLPVSATSDFGLMVVPAFLFEAANVNWAASAVETAERSYSKVRVLNSNDVPLSAVGSPDGEKRRRGRPSNRSKIDGAIDSLIAEGAALATMLRPKAIDAVLERLALSVDVERTPGLSRDTIQDALLSKFGPRIASFN